MTLKPRQNVPALDLPLAGGGRFVLADATPERFTLMIVYRGVHCPICKSYLGAFNQRLEDYEERGVAIVAVSADSRERAEKAKSEWGLAAMPVAYGFDTDTAREWGLYISKAIREAEPAVFTEPGLFLINADGTLQVAVLSSTPQLRPDAEAVLKTVDFIIERDYPARGEA